MRIKTGDTVIVIAGKEKGKTGKVLKTLPKENRVIVENLNMVTKHMKMRVTKLTKWNTKSRSSYSRF